MFQLQHPEQRALPTSTSRTLSPRTTTPAAVAASSSAASSDAAGSMRSSGNSPCDSRRQAARRRREREHGRLVEVAERARRQRHEVTAAVRAHRERERTGRERRAARHSIAPLAIDRHERRGDARRGLWSRGWLCRAAAAPRHGRLCRGWFHGT